MSWIPPVVSAWEKLSSTSRTLTWIYSRPYKQVVKNEIHFAGISSQDTVLNIGCGAVPFTAIYLATLTGAKVVALDKDPQAARLATNCVHNLGLQHMIEVRAMDGSAFHDAGHSQHFTAAIVALQAAPKDRILKGLQASTAAGSRLIFRLPSPAYQQHYDTLETDNSLNSWIRQPMRTFDRSVLYLQSTNNLLSGIH